MTGDVMRVTLTRRMEERAARRRAAIVAQDAAGAPDGYSPFHRSGRPTTSHQRLASGSQRQRSR